jgi:hypothetical protein
MEVKKMQTTQPITAINIETTIEELIIRLPDREVGILWEQCSPRLAAANAVQRQQAELSPGGYGIHWPLLDEDLSIIGLVQKVDGSSKKRKRPLQFTIRFLLLLFFPAALIGYFLYPGVINVDIKIEKISNLIEQPSGKKSLCAVVSVKNNASQTVWYQGATHGHPDFYYNALIDGQWQSGSYSCTPTQRIALQGGEKIVFIVPITDDTKSLVVGVQFASRWFKTINQYVISPEMPVEYNE